jgi:nicotinamidase-related amidase
MSYTAPHFSTSALLTIDMQADFVYEGAIAEIPGTKDVLRANQKIVQTFRTAQRPIIHVVRLYEKDGSNVDLCRRHMIESGKCIVAPDSDGAELAGSLKPTDLVRLDAKLLLKGEWQELAPKEWVMYKSRWGAFYNTQLESKLRALGIDTVVVIGCNFPNCPRTTIYEASERDFKIVFVEDAVSQVYEKGSAELRNIGVSVMKTEELINTF